MATNNMNIFSDIKILSWNIASLRKRYSDLHHKVMTEDIDIVCLQESRTPNGKHPQNLTGYKCYDPITKNTCLMYVKKSLPHEPLSSTKCDGFQYHGIRVHVGNSTLNVLNAYAPTDLLHYTDLPDFVHIDPTVLIGDLNAKHKTLGDQLTNTNGRRLVTLLNAYDDVQIISKNQPTQMYGGVLDRCIGFNLSYTTHESDIVDDLMSDHNAITANIHVSNVALPGTKLSRRRLTVSQGQENNFIGCIENWYKNYEPANAQNFYDDIVNTIYETITISESNQKKRNTGQRGRQHQYYDDPKLRELKSIARQTGKGYKNLRTPQMLKLFQASLAAARERMTELRQNDWESFVSGLNQHTPLSKAWKGINKIIGKKSRQVSHPNPLRKANELITKWAQVSSYKMLPASTRDNLRGKSNDRNALINFMLNKQHDECDDPYTDYELDAALARGSSTAPGEDGITYDILRLLHRVPGNPLLELFNMSYITGQLPVSWTSSLTVPIPKPRQPDAFRPISLTSCMCKTFERMVLNRLLYRIREHMSPDINGFTHGKSVHNCITTFFTVHGDGRHKYTTFLDLKNAFDIANREVILYELARMDIGGQLLQWIQGYLTNRKSSALFQGYKSETKLMQLGTPQGGVLSPTLFNVLMNALLNSIPTSPTNVTISYADDILVHTKTHREMQIILNCIHTACENLGLVINTEKTKVFNSHIGNRKSGPQKLKIDNIPIDYVSAYKYLGISVPCTLAAVNKLHQQCKDRLKALRTVVGYSPHYGVNVRIAKMMYLAYIRSLIDYHAPALVLYNSNRIDKLEKMQNEALRIILGCPITTKVLNMRKELDIPSIQDRIFEVNLMIGLKLLRGNENNIVSVELLEHIRSGTSDSGWIQRTATHIKMFGLTEVCKDEKAEHFLPPWQITPFDIMTPTYPTKKLITHNPHAQLAAKLSTLEHIHNLQTESNITQTIYTDGSLNSVTGRAGSAVIVHQPDGNTIERNVRVSNWASTLQVELLAILVALEIIENTAVDSLIISDSLSSLLALNSLQSNCNVLVSEARHRYMCIITRGVKVKLLWIPSHIGLQEHDKVDALAKLAVNKDNVEQKLGLSNRTLKSVIRRELLDEFEESRRVQTGTSRSIVYHNNICQTKHLYGASNKVSRLTDVVTARIRLGYKYIWQFGWYGDLDEVKCKVCGQRQGHTLEHYILHCVKIEPFRDKSKLTLHEMANHFIVNDKISEILVLYPDFASSR